MDQSQIELLECFDEEGRSIGPRTREEVHTQPLAFWHGVSSVWLLNSKGHILCSKRSDAVSGNPGKWQTYFGGHVKAGSDFLKTVQDELQEETGVSFPSESLKFIDSGKREDVMHLYHLYAVLFDQDLLVLNFADGEIVEARWFNFDDYNKEKSAHPDDWCNSMKPDQYEKAITVLGLSVRS